MNCQDRVRQLELIALTGVIGADGESIDGCGPECGLTCILWRVAQGKAVNTRALVGDLWQGDGLNCCAAIVDRIQSLLTDTGSHPHRFEAVVQPDGIVADQVRFQIPEECEASH